MQKRLLQRWDQPSLPHLHDSMRHLHQWFGMYKLQCHKTSNIDSSSTVQLHNEGFLIESSYSLVYCLLLYMCDMCNEQYELRNLQQHCP